MVTRLGLAALLLLVGCSSAAGTPFGSGADAGADADVVDSAVPVSDGGSDSAADDAADAADSASVVDAGTGWLGDPCVGGPGSCQPGLTCWQTDTPVASTNMRNRCTYDCSSGNATRAAVCANTYGGKCESYSDTASDTICVPQ